MWPWHNTDVAMIRTKFRQLAATLATTGLIWVIKWFRVKLFHFGQSASEIIP